MSTVADAKKLIANVTMNDVRGLPQPATMTIFTGVVILDPFFAGPPGRIRRGTVSAIIPNSAGIVAIANQTTLIATPAVFDWSGPGGLVGVDSSYLLRDPSGNIALGCDVAVQAGKLIRIAYQLTIVASTNRIARSSPVKSTKSIKPKKKSKLTPAGTKK